MTFDLKNIEDLHSSDLPSLVKTAVQYKKASLNGKVIISENIVSKSIDLKKEKLAVENELNARKLFPKLTIDLIASWQSNSIGYIVYKKESNIYNENWFLWKTFLRNIVYNKILKSDDFQCVYFGDWIAGLADLYPDPEIEELAELSRAIKRKVEEYDKHLCGKIYLTHVHGDLLPSNVIITKTFHIKLIDWTNGGFCPVFYDQLIPIFYGNANKIFSQDVISYLTIINNKCGLDFNKEQIKHQVLASFIYYYKYNAFRYDIADQQRVYEGVDLLERALGLL